MGVLLSRLSVRYLCRPLRFAGILSRERVISNSSMAAALSLDGLQDVLTRWGTSRFHIEFPAPSGSGLFFSSHLLHAVVALHGLGASVERLEEHAKKHASMLSPAREDDASVQLTWKQCKELLGKREQFPELSRFFLDEMKTRSPGAVVGYYLPEMLDGGVYSALFHPYIHIGYGLLSGRNEEVADGLAYMVMSCRPTQHVEESLEVSAPGDTVSTSQGAVESGLNLESDQTPILRQTHPGLVLLRRLRQDQRLQKLLTIAKERIDPDTIVKETGRGVWTNTMYMIHDYAEEILEKHVDDSGLLSVVDKDDTKCLLRRVFEGAVITYALSRPADDFFLLHGLTSAWMMSVIAPHLSPDNQRLMLRKFCIALSALYVSREFPRIRDLTLPDEANIPSWDAILKVAIANDDFHTPKVVYSCHEAEKAFGPLVEGVPLYRVVAACRLGLLGWP